jgi:putative salt-induced outer membrane protein
MRTTILASVLTLMMAAVPVLADEEEAPPEPTWTGEAGLSFVATGGNSDSETLGLNFTVERKPTPWGVVFGASFIRAEQEGELTAERYTGFVRGNRRLGERWELFARATGEQDQFAGFDLRGVIDAGATYKALLGPTHTLSFDGGLAWTTEDYIEGQGADNDYFGAVLGLDYAWAFSANASLGQIVDYFPNFDNTNDWRLVSETSLQASLTSLLALKLAYLIRYDNEPVPGFDDTDTTATASVVLKF